MKKQLKVILLLILLIIIWIILYLWFWSRKNNNISDKPITTENIAETWEISEINITENEEWDFEEDVMKDLEWFFNDNNGYENVEWEFWFTNPENE